MIARWNAVVSCTVLTFAWAAGVAAAAGSLEVVPLDSRMRIGCARDGDDIFVTAKAELGDNRIETIASAAMRLAGRLSRLDAKVAMLEEQPPTQEVMARLAKLERIRSRLMSLAQGLASCADGSLFDNAAPPAFEVLCRHGFHAPSAARNRECGIDLSKMLAPPMAAEAMGRSGPATAPRATSPAAWDIEATAGILDELFADACEATGGILLRNTTLSDDAPLYSAYCGKIGRPVVTHYQENLLILAMEEEPTGPCIVAMLQASDADDGCGDYRRPPGGGGGGGTPPPPPDDDDCIIVRMEEEPTGCE
ncbi:MAG TPA: hypothetical protein VEC57_07430 [Candidatus Limnocylindrales bacterium]|nr:hypothetical protein [Candidatus Limnocylindrales bacterium]